jgi:hypothetical protein
MAMARKRTPVPSWTASIALGIVILVLAFLLMR